MREKANFIKYRVNWWKSEIKLFYDIWSYKKDSNNQCSYVTTIVFKRHAYREIKEIFKLCFDKRQRFADAVCHMTARYGMNKKDSQGDFQKTINYMSFEIIVMEVIKKETKPLTKGNVIEVNFGK